MKERRIGSLISPLVLLSFLSIPQPADSQTKTLTRTEDPVVICGDKLSGLAGFPVELYSLFSLREQKFEPIPFQIDEKNKKNEFVFNQGTKTSEDEDPNFDENDELVFMVFDSGDKAEKELFPKDAFLGMEIEIVDPIDNKQAFVYLFVFENNPPKSRIDYVNLHYDRKTNHFEVSARNYLQRSVADAIYYDFLSLRSPDGKETPDLIDRLKIRGLLSAFFGTVKIPFNFDEQVHSRVTAWKDGPVRVLRRGEGYLELVEVKIKGTGYAVLYFYPNFFIYPMTLDIPFELRKVLTDIDIYGATDFTANAYGWHYYDEKNPYREEVVLDGKMGTAEEKLNFSFDHNWHCNIGPQGTFFHRIIFPEEWNFIKKEVFYMDKAELKDPPEDNPGMIANGYHFRNFINLKKGSQTYWMHYYFPWNFKIGDEKRILDILDNPLRLKFNQIKIR